MHYRPQHQTRKIKSGLMALSALSVIAAASMSNAAMAQEKPATAAYDFQISAQPLSQSIVQAASIANIQILYSDELPANLQAPALSGRMTIDEALARLLSGTGYTFRYTQPGVVTIVSSGAAGNDGERVLGAVRVQGAQGGGSGLAGSTPVNGVNGSRDVTATEGTGSYTSNALTVGSKTAASIKDTAMAVSVITDQQIKDQNITDLNTAMRDAPGITVLHDSGGGQPNFWSRGFQITQLQIDGGAPQTFTNPGNGLSPLDFVGNYRPIIDLSLYDHLELVRGATGTFNGYGNPGGVINLVRKRPLDHAQMTIDMQLGSWDWHRFSADVTGPLAFDGKLRARFIATHQDNNYFYDIAKANRNVLSGTLELDVTPTTLVSAGVNYQEQNDAVGAIGLPRYQTGKAIDFPRGRATCLCVPWAINNSRNFEYFGQIEQRISDRWTFKIKGTRIQQKSRELGASVSGTADPITGIGPQIHVGFVGNGRVRQTQIEATLDGSFQLLGQTQKLILGANYSLYNPTGSFDAGFNYDPVTFRQIYFENGLDNDSKVGDVRKFDPSAWQLADGYGTIPSRGTDYGDLRAINFYTSFELTPFKNIHITSALRYSTTRNRIRGYDICTPFFATFPGDCLGQPGKKQFYNSGRSNKGNNFSWPPSVQLKFDLTKNLSSYAAYTDIYVNRSQFLSDKGIPLPPTTGSNYEGGLKWLSPSGKTNINLSVYYTKQINTSYIQTSNGNSPSDIPGQFTSITSCCYINWDGVYGKSYGVDIEYTGEVTNNLQLSANYTYNNNKQYYPGDIGRAFDGSREPLQSQAPHHLAKLWATYAFDDRSKLNGLRLGFGAQARSSTFVVDRYCPVDPVSTPDGPQCPNPPGRKLVFFTDPGYAVFSGSIGYRFNDKLSFDAQFENLFDKTYFEQVGGIGGGNWYGSPRSIKVSLRGKF